jgi:short-subunit dehydrogenase
LSSKRSLDGKLVLITGASSGIGEAAALAFAQAGALLILTARREERLQALANRLRGSSSGSETLVVRADLTQTGEIERLAAEALAWHGRVDVLVNNAGFGRLRWLETLDPLEDVVAQISLDLVAPLLLTRALLPAMIHQRDGCIINVASVAALIGVPTYTVYSAAKFGLRGMSEALRREVRPFGISVCLLCPGPVATEFGQHVQREARTEIAIARRLRLPAQQVADRIVGLARHPRPMVVMPWYMGGLSAVNSSLPGLFDLLIDRFYMGRLRGRKPRGGAAPPAHPS